MFVSVGILRRKTSGIREFGDVIFLIFNEIIASIWARGRFQICDSVRVAGVDVFGSHRRVFPACAVKIRHFFRLPRGP